MPKTNENPYAEYGCKNRKEYLRMLAEEHEIPAMVVFAIADTFGPSEDFDGLVSELEDLGACYSGDW